MVVTVLNPKDPNYLPAEEKETADSLTHIRLESHFWDIEKQCRPRSDTAERGVWSGSALFANINFYKTKKE